LTLPSRTCARIDLNAIISNYRSIRQAIGGRPEIMAVVKADAYGHGAIEVARALAAQGCGKFAVACVVEAVELRGSGLEGEIAVLSGLLAGEEPLAAHLRLTPFMQDPGQIERWNDQARADGRRLSYHLEIDTGMNRCGFDHADVNTLATLVERAGDLDFEGLASHHASAEDFTSDQYDEQQRRFSAVAATLAQRGLRPSYLHCANSVALAYRPELDLDLVRPGISLYGYVSRAQGDAPASRLRLTPALEWMTRIQKVRNIEAGALVGYNGQFQAERETRIGVLPVGYGDGLDRRLSNRGEVLVAGRRCPIIGLISMDVTLVDLTDVPQAVAGDEVTLLGESLDAADMASRRGTISLEVLCGISKRVPRVYIR
jgi:alanine racemase